MNRQTARGTARLTERDQPFVRALYALVVLSGRQAKKYFYPGIADVTFDNRMRRLKEGGFIDYPSREQYQHHPIPERVFWLGIRGIADIAIEQSIEADLSGVTTQTQEKAFENRLRKQGIYWRRVPSWSRLKHDIRVADIYFMAKAAANRAGLTWVGWMPEWEFRSSPELQRVTYRTKEQPRGGYVEEIEKTGTIYPDGFFVVSRPASQADKTEMIAYLVQVDMSTERGYQRFEVEKIALGEAYVMSELYTQRTGLTRGRWIFITTSRIRRDRLKARAEAVSKVASHYFSVFDELSAEGFFSDPVWYLMGRSEPIPLLHPPS